MPTMGLDISALWTAPKVNPLTRKANSLPILNPVDPYGRVFFFSWLGFMLAFWAWYTFPPLLTVTIRDDLGLTEAEVANSNIVSLIATLLLRFISGPLCDQFGPRNVYAALLFIGCLPVGLAPLVKDATGLYVSRFFLGILGATFVPCQVWCTGFFDKNIVGTANSFAGGFGNAGGGLTYLLMPAIFDSFVHDHGMSAHKAWRVTFVVPLLCLIACGIGMILLCPETPLGPWKDRFCRMGENLEAHGISKSPHATESMRPSVHASDVSAPDEEKATGTGTDSSRKTSFEKEQDIFRAGAIQTARGEMVVKPSFRDTLSVVFSPQTLFHVATYACSFGGELAINSILGSYYKKNFPRLSQTNASNYASVFGFLNLVTRPLGGIVADILYRRFGGSLWAKKFWITACGLATGSLLIVIGTVDPREDSGHGVAAMLGLVAAMAVFHEAGNGANFALVPHVHPSANGVLSGATGAGGNLGGVVFAVIFRFMNRGRDYASGFWVIGVINIALNVAVCWIRPIPRGQVGGS